MGDDFFTNNRGDCLEDETVTDYISGTVAPAVRLACEEHLVVCRPCRERLTLFMSLLQEEVLDSEMRTVEEASRRWDLRFGGHRVGPKYRPPLAVFAGSFLILLSLSAMVAGLLQWRAAEPSAQEIVSLLLSQYRPFEARLSGQPHRPFERTRSVAESLPSTDLLETKLRSLGATSLELGRLFLIQGDLEKAADELSQAESRTEGRAASHNDYGVYWLERRDVDFVERALTEFDHALIEDPGFLPALYNRALALERLGELSRADLAWRVYLRVDPQSDWSAEARSRLEVLGR